MSSVYALRNAADTKEDADATLLLALSGYAAARSAGGLKKRWAWERALASASAVWEDERRPRTGGDGRPGSRGEHDELLFRERGRKSLRSRQHVTIFAAAKNSAEFNGTYQ